MVLDLAAPIITSLGKGALTIPQGNLSGWRQAWQGLPFRAMASLRRMLPMELAPLFLGIFAIGTNLFIVVPLLPAVQRDFPGASVSDLGQFLVGSYALTYALLAPALGPISDRVGRVPVIRAGMAMLAIATIASALSPSLTVLAAARAAAGIGAALLTPATYAFVGDQYAYEGRQRAMAVVLAGLPVSTVAGVPLAGLLAAASSWRWGLGAVSAIAVMALLSSFRLSSPRTTRQSGHWPSLLATLRDRTAMTPISVSFLWFVASLGLFTYIGQYLYSLFDFGARERALAVGAYGLMGLVGEFGGAGFARRAGKRVAVLLGLSGLVGAFVLVAVNHSSAPLAVLSLAVWGAASWFGMPSQQAIISELQPLARGTLLSLNNSSMYLGAMIGSALMGRMLAVAGFAGAGGLAAGVIAAAALITGLAVRERGPVAVNAAPPPG
jgi:predicted MFS family arabinose efflux permease